MKRIAAARFAALMAVLSILWTSCCVSSTAQTFDASHLGTPIVKVTGNWRVHYGDDPRWAAADFDDSSWQLQPADKEVTLDRQYKGFLWYRMRVEIPAHHQPLSISIENHLNSIQIFANDRLVGAYGGMPPHESSYEWRRVDFPLGVPADVSSLEIAIRLWSPVLFKPGLGPHAIAIGDASAIANSVKEDRRGIVEFIVQYWVVNAAFLLLSLAVLALFAFQPDRKEYLWLALWQFSQAIAGFVTALRNLALIPDWTQYDISIPFQFIALCFLLEFYYAFVRERPGRWIRGLQVLLLLNISLGPVLFYGHPPPKIFGALELLPEVEIIAIAIVITWMLIIRFRGGNREAGLLLIPTVLSNFSTVIGLAQEAGYALGWVKTQNRPLPDTHFGDFVFTADTWFSILFFLTILALLFYRFLNVSRQQTRAAAEIEAARQVQQVLLPEQVLTVPGVIIESEYHPADVVGGDFFQVVPASDGSLLVVVGDVAGKGMGAAMLVGVIIGTIRTAVQFDASPAFMLSTLNERLCGRAEGSFVTCLAARLLADGELTIANAGHLSPYLNGEELITIPELPLGVVDSVGYVESRFLINPGDRLTFVSDGVVEATRPGGELFGFDRTRAISRDAANAIAQAAKAFGQNDDITVVTLTRTAELVPVA